MDQQQLVTAVLTTVLTVVAYALVKCVKHRRHFVSECCGGRLEVDDRDAPPSP